MIENRHRRLFFKAYHGAQPWQRLSHPERHLETHSLTFDSVVEANSTSFYTFTHPFALLLSEMASQSFTSWWPSSAVANNAGVFLPLAMCS